MSTIIWTVSPNMSGRSKDSSFEVSRAVPQYMQKPLPSISSRRVSRWQPGHVTTTKLMGPPNLVLI